MCILVSHPSRPPLLSITRTYADTHWAACRNHYCHRHISGSNDRLSILPVHLLCPISRHAPRHAGLTPSPLIPPSLADQSGDQESVGNREGNEDGALGLYHPAVSDSSSPINILGACPQITQLASLPGACQQAGASRSRLGPGLHAGDLPPWPACQCIKQVSGGREQGGLTPVWDGRGGWYNRQTESQCQ